MIVFVHLQGFMSFPFQIGERLRLLLSQTLDKSHTVVEANIKIMEKFQPLEIPEAEVSPPIPDELSSRQFPQKELVAGITELLPSILKTPTPDEEWLFVALTLLESIEETEAKFFFPLEMHQEASVAILQWATAYQEKNYMLPPLMATIHWGIVTQ